jgi:hypothetical protein
LKVIREANDSVARFKEVKPAMPSEEEKPDPFAEPVSFPEDRKSEPAGATKAEQEENAKAKTEKPKTDKSAKPQAAAGDPNHKVFRSPIWEMELTLSRNDKQKYVLRGTLTNISKRRQTLGETVFKVYLTDRGGDFAQINVNREPMGVGEKHVIKDELVPEHVIVQGLFGVEQVLTWRTAPVKRIDRMEIGDRAAFSSRTSHLALTGPKYMPKGKAEKKGRRRGGKDAQGEPLEADDEGGSDDPGASSTAAGLSINRYVDANDQVRHMPVAMALLVREDNIPDVLAAFTNSQLRIEVTQFHWHHSRDRIQPPILDAPPTSKDETQQAKPRRRTGKGEGGVDPTEERTPPNTVRGKAAPAGTPSLRGGNLSITLGTPALQGKTGTESVDQEDDMNLMEVAVYGIAALYEKYPPKPADNAAGGASADPSAKQPTKTDEKK